MERAEPASISFDTLHKTAQGLLTHHYGSDVGIRDTALLTDPGRRNRIWRCRLHATDPLVPATVIVKQVSPTDYDPVKVETWDTSRFFRDWAGARFLSEHASEEAHGPKFYGGNVEHGFIILEDMGAHASLVEPLLKGNAADATEALIAFATRLGRMHAATHGKEAAFQQIQRDISPAWADVDATLPAARTGENAVLVAEFRAIGASLGADFDEAATKEFAEALQGLDQPGPFRAFIHGDPCPDNVFLQPPVLRLIDFEMAAFGHVLLDGLYGRLPFPTCWCANAVPGEVMEKMEHAYRAAFAVACPEVLNDARFIAEACVVAAHSAFTTLKWHLGDALEQDNTWGIAGVRARLLSRLQMFLDTAHRAGSMPELRKAYAQILTELQRQWPDAVPLPVYPAFRAD
jgi:hypothetical protein